TVGWNYVPAGHFDAFAGELWFLSWSSCCVDPEVEHGAHFGFAPTNLGCHFVVRCTSRLEACDAAEHNECVAFDIAAVCLRVVFHPAIAVDILVIICIGGGRD